MMLTVADERPTASAIGIELVRSNVQAPRPTKVPQAQLSLRSIWFE